MCEWETLVKIITDNAMSLIEQEFQKTLVKNNVEYYPTTLLHSQSNGIVKRLIGTTNVKLHTYYLKTSLIYW